VPCSPGYSRIGTGVFQRRVGARHLRRAMVAQVFNLC
jgi:hypothetical protein